MDKLMDLKIDRQNTKYVDKIDRQFYGDLKASRQKIDR